MAAQPSKHKVSPNAEEDKTSSDVLKAPVPSSEEARLDVLRRYKILDTHPEQVFDDLTFLASHICGTPISVISLVDADRQWFKSKVGLAATETSRDIAFCAHAILQPEPFIVPDTRSDQRFARNPLVTKEPYIRFYAGFPLMTPEGFALGTLCVIDREPRTLRPEQVKAMVALSHQAMTHLEHRRHLAEITETIEALEQVKERLRKLRKKVKA